MLHKQYKSISLLTLSLRLFRNIRDTFVITIEPCLYIPDTVVTIVGKVTFEIDTEVELFFREISFLDFLRLYLIKLVNTYFYLFNTNRYDYFVCC